MWQQNLIEMSKKTLLDTRQRLLDMNKNLGLDMPDDHLDSIYQVYDRPTSHLTHHSPVLLHS